MLLCLSAQNRRHTGHLNIMHSSQCCVLLCHRVGFQLFLESCLVAAGENAAFPVTLLHDKSFY